MKIGILIPAHNEAMAIQEIVEALKQKNLAIFVVDDGSTDNTKTIAEQAGAKVLVNKEKSGKGFSIRRGFDYLIREGFDGVIMMDGDGQHDVKDIDQFIVKAEEGEVDILLGNRMENSKNMPRVRYWTNCFMSKIISWTCGQNLADTQCGYRYLSAKALKKINLETTGFEIETEILIKASRENMKIMLIPIQTIYRNEKSKIAPVKDTMRFFSYYFKEVFSGLKNK